ncbi:AAA family ATPase [bacterium]|nr:AAA family ATPase [bacterium]
MIQKVSSLNLNIYNNFNKRVEKSNNQTNPILNTNTNSNIIGVPFSYVSFKGDNEVKKTLRLTEGAGQLISKALLVVKENNHSEITSYHIIQAAINDTLVELEDIDKNLEKENYSTLLNLANTFANKNVIVDEEEREFFIEEIENLNVLNQASLNALPKIEVKNIEKYPLSESLQTKMLSFDTEINADILLASAFDDLTASGVDYTDAFLGAFSTLGAFKSVKETNSNYYKQYDSKALEIWHKLALGSSLFVTTKNDEEKNRIIASIANTIQDTKYGNFNEENTYIYHVNENIEPENLEAEINAIKENVPDKKLIFAIDMDKIVEKSILQKDNGSLEYKPFISTFPELAKDNVKFILLQDDNKHYGFMLNPVIKKLYSNYINYSLAPLQSYETIEILKHNRKILKDVSKPFTTEAKEMTVLLADKLEGCHPDKSINLMKRIAEYYGDDVKKITPKHVEEFSYIASDLFNQKVNTDPIVYNTGKTLATYYGKETTKKDIENIVKLIKTGRIGTQGILISSKDNEAGAGKKYTAEVIAGEARVPFLETDSSQFALSSYEASEARITPAAQMGKMFSDIKKAAKQNQYKTAILYINNFDELSLSGVYNPGYKQALDVLSKEMEKAVKEDINIIVMGSSGQNYTDIIPMAIKGFSQNIIVDSPAYDSRSRKEILETLIKQKDLPLNSKNKADKTNLIDKVVKITRSFSYTNLKDLITKAKYIAIERDKKRVGIGEFIEAYLQLITGRTSRPDTNIHDKKVIASHECGHATNIEVMNNIYRNQGKPWSTSQEVNFITLDPRSDFMGAVFHGFNNNKMFSLETLFAELVCSLGGHSCEKAFFDIDGSGGIAGDLESATRRAKFAVERYGIGYNTGKISNAARIPSSVYNENVFNDIDVILTNAQIASDMITEAYKDFNVWFTEKYSKLIGTDKCMLDGEEFRNELKAWIASRPEAIKEELNIVEDIIMDIIKSTKNGKKYYQIKKVIK